MKKHSKTGVESRFQGTVLGLPAEPKPIRIEGGPVESIDEWCTKTREKAAKEAAKENRNTPNHVMETREVSGDTIMDIQDGDEDAPGEVTEDITEDMMVTEN